MIVRLEIDQIEKGKICPLMSGRPFPITGPNLQPNAMRLEPLIFVCVEQACQFWGKSSCCFKSAVGYLHLIGDSLMRLEPPSAGGVAFHLSRIADGMQDRNK